MTLKEEWFENPKLAEELQKILQNPTLKTALQIIKEDTMASSMMGSSCLENTNLNVFFGVDMGRAAALKDLQALATVAKPKKQPTQNYKG